MRSGLLNAGMITFFMLAALLPSNAATLIVRPGPDDGKDVSLYKRTDVPLSSGPSLYVINTGPPGPGLDSFASLVEFDLDELSPMAAKVASAKLWLYENNVPTFSFQHVSIEYPNTIEVRPAETPWFEDNIFYSTLPEPALGYSVTQIVDAVATWFSWDVTDAVKDWLNGPLPNNGFLITSKSEVRNGSIVVGSSFDASEQNNPPYLEIELMNINAGDYNLNGQRDAADYVVWRKQFSTQVQPFTGADGNGDGMVNAADYTVWQSNFGNVDGASLHHSTAAPEPPTTVLLMLVSGMVAGQMRLVRCRTGIRRVLLVFFALQAIAAPTSAAVIPFTEDFSTGAANWKDTTNADVTYVPSGGVGGVSDGYISVQRTFTANPTTAQTIFRGHDQFNSSGDAFVGDWRAAGITHFSFWVRHNATSDLTFGTRFATSANSPGANGIGIPTVTPNVWARVQIPISPTNVSPEGGPALFDSVFASVGNLQISARPGNNLSVPIRFDVDRVTIVPEPTTVGTLCLLTGLGTILIRCRFSRCIFPAALFVGVFGFASGAITFADTKHKSETSLTPLPEPLSSFGAATHRGWLYVYGGHVGETHEHSCDHVRGNFRRQPLSGGEWEELQPGPALQSPALVSHGKFLYRIGGLAARNSSEEESDLHSVDSVARYDAEAGVWQPLPRLPNPRSSHDAAVLGDRIFVAGGWHHHGEEGDADWHDSLVVLDLSKEEKAPLNWSIPTTSPFKRRAFAVAAHNGNIYCIGGMTPSTSFSRRVDIYEPKSNAWSRGPNLPETEMNGFGASAFGVDGQLYVSSLSDKLWRLSADGTDWQPFAVLQQPRFFHRIVPGSKKCVLLIGGANHSSHLDSIMAIRTSL